MYLSMWIFAEWLKDFQPTIQIKENTMTIDTIRLFSSSTPMNDHTLYIGRMKDFSGIPEDFHLTGILPAQLSRGNNMCLPAVFPAV